MNVGELRKILNVCEDDAEILVVGVSGEEQAIDGSNYRLTTAGTSKLVLTPQVPTHVPLAFVGGSSVSRAAMARLATVEGHAQRAAQAAQERRASGVTTTDFGGPFDD